MNVLEQFDQERVFYFFEEITKIPHGSGNEKALSDYLVAFAKERNLYYIQDEAYNVCIKKNGALGCENGKTVILQGHIDMVCEKNSDVIHDFIKEPLDIYVENGFIHARGTTLGADNGIAVAYMLALLDSNTIPHPPLEGVFTVDEEVGMKGAFQLDTSILEGKWFLNMDTEEEGVLLSGCAGVEEHVWICLWFVCQMRGRVTKFLFVA
ncbi:M20/M25/M40 family metallo-hydrolase [Chakrabartyella piscis]|uniref:M20/M25/M40 family metallo-hydrolase n=1 Tax=Chakrabartyella piscis TaxID=2918914 RepID=UPI0029583971|nr:M20/M25/M40 family metallo-hydrolase [Chakrabartyella piscis]